MTRPDSRVMKPAPLRSRCSPLFFRLFNLSIWPQAGQHPYTETRVLVLSKKKSNKFPKKIGTSQLFSTPKFHSMAAECCVKPSINWPIRPLFFVVVGLTIQTSLKRRLLAKIGAIDGHSNAPIQVLDIPGTLRCGI